MLHIGRKQGESIMIGDHIRVTVLSVLGKKVRLGIEFPSASTDFQIDVHREEVYHRIQQENIAAAESAHLINLWGRS